MGCPRCGGRVRSYHSERLAEDFTECTRCGWTPDDIDEPMCDKCNETMSDCNCVECEYCGEKSMDDTGYEQTEYGLYCERCAAELHEEDVLKQEPVFEMPDLSTMEGFLKFVGVAK